RDLAVTAESLPRLFAEPAVQRLLPLIVAEALANPDKAPSLNSQYAPGHEPAARPYGAPAAPSGFRAEPAPEPLPTMLTGAGFYRLVSTGRPPDRAFMEQVVGVILRGLQVGSPG